MSARRDAGRRDVGVGVGVVLIAALGWFGLIPVGIDLPSNVPVAALSPDFWPRIVMVILAVSGTLVAVQGLVVAHREGRGGSPMTEVSGEVAPAAPADVPADTSADVMADGMADGMAGENSAVAPDPGEYPLALRMLRVAVALALMFAFYLSVPYAGVPLGAVVVIIVFGRLLGQRSWWRVVVLAVVLPSLLYLFFSEVARIPIPLGLFEALR